MHVCGGELANGLMVGGGSHWSFDRGMQRPYKPQQLLERKRGAIEFAAAAARPPQRLPSDAASSGGGAATAVGGKRKGDASEYDFRGVAGFVAEAEQARAALRQRQEAAAAAAAPAAGGGLAALAQYDDDDDE